MKKNHKMYFKRLSSAKLHHEVSLGWLKNNFLHIWSNPESKVAGENAFIRTQDPYITQNSQIPRQVARTLRPTHRFLMIVFVQILYFQTQIFF